MNHTQVNYFFIPNSILYSRDTNNGNLIHRFCHQHYATFGESLRGLNGILWKVILMKVNREKAGKAFWSTRNSRFHNLQYISAALMQ